MNGKVKASSAVAGAGAGALIAWLWNGFVVEPAMPAEVAAVVGGMAGPVIRWLVAWLPEPQGE